MTDGQTEATVEATTNAPTETVETKSEATPQGIQEANIAALEKTDPIETGLQQPVKLEGVADTAPKVYGEKQAPVAAPIQQIAPVSTNGEQTSSREAMKADAPAQIVQVSQTGANHNPSAQEASPSVPPVESQPETVAEPAEPEVAFEDLPPLEQANNLLGQIPGRFRLY